MASPPPPGGFCALVCPAPRLAPRLISIGTWGVDAAWEELELVGTIEAATRGMGIPRAEAPTTVPNLFVVPAYNEAANLPNLFRDLEARPGLFPDGSSVIVVDDGSADETAAV